MADNGAGAGSWLSHPGGMAVPGRSRSLPAPSLTQNYFSQNFLYFGLIAQQQFYPPGSMGGVVSRHAGCTNIGGEKYAGRTTVS